jgi:hypothetical protein
MSVCRGGSIWLAKVLIGRARIDYVPHHLEAHAHPRAVHLALEICRSPSSSLCRRLSRSLSRGTLPSSFWRARMVALFSSTLYAPTISITPTKEKSETHLLQTDKVNLHSHNPFLILDPLLLPLPFPSQISLEHNNLALHRGNPVLIILLFLPDATAAAAATAPNVFTPLPLVAPHLITSHFNH